jgi:acetyl esterase
MSHPRNPQSLLTPESRQVLHAIAKAGRPPIYMMTPEQAKAAYSVGAQILELPAHKMARDDTIHIPTRDGASLRARLWSEHQTPNLPVLLYFHGGGFTVGSPETHEALCRQLAHLAQCAVISVDYRLAPEHTFPTAHHDAQDSLLWVHQQGAALGLDTTRLAIGGDSAGGTLSASTAIFARDQGIDLALQVLFYPGCAADYMDSAHTFEKGFLLEKASVDYFYGHYLNNDDEHAHPSFAVLKNPDVSGVAPVWMGLAECDPIVDEGIAYADYLRMSGVTVDLEIYRGVIHTFIQMSRVIPEAITARQDAARALKQAFASKESS